MRYKPASATASSSNMETGLLQPAWRRSHLSRRLLAAVLALVVLQGTVSSAQVDVDPSQITLVEGQKATLMCRSGKPINYCRFVVPGESQVVVLSEQWPSKVPGYSYYGQGTQAGQCGVTIERVTAKNHGKVKCDLGIEGEELSGAIDLTVALPPHRPELEITSRPPRNFFEADEVLQAKCISRDGRPPANMTWFLNDEPITQGLELPEQIETPGAGNTTLFTVVQRINRRLMATDDGKFLVCRTAHIADQGQNNMVKTQLLVKYRPVPQPEITVYGVTLTRTALINVTIQSNPRPRVEWSVSGVVILEGTQNGRYEAYEPVELGNGEYTVVLSIDSLSLEDTTKDYFLRASNELGQQEYTVRISSSNTPASSGLDIGAIIGIVVAVAILLIIVVLIVFARATGRWCFGGASLNTDIGPDSEAQINPHLNDDFDGKDVYDPEEHIDTTQQSEKSSSPTSETSDTESAELRSTRFKKLPNFTAIFKKKPTDNQETNEANRSNNVNEDEQRLASVTAEVPAGTDAPDSGEDKQLVYAELVLKPADDKAAPTQKDSTEYAEIVHVQKPNDQPPNNAASK